MCCPPHAKCDARCSVVYSPAEAQSTLASFGASFASSMAHERSLCHCYKNAGMAISIALTQGVPNRGRWMWQMDAD